MKNFVSFLCFQFLLILLSCKVSVSSNENSVVRDIKISSLPTKTVYNVGEKIDYSGLKITALYTDGSEKEITDYTLSLKSGTVLSKKWTYTIEVRYKEFVQTFEIKVLAVIKGIKISSLPKKTTYYVGDFVDYEGLKIAATYSDGSENEITDYLLSLKSGTVLSKEKTYIIEVEYKGFVQTFYIEVLPVITGIKISSPPKKITYYVGDSVDYSELKIAAIYSDGSEKEITDYTLSLKNGTKLSKEQIYKIEVQYKEFIQTFDIEVLPVITGIKVSSPPKKITYYVGDSVDYDGLKITAVYSDGSEKEITDYTLSLKSGTVLSKKQTYTIEVEYKEFVQTFDIEVFPVVTGIKVSSLPEKTTYYVGDSVDYSELKIAAIYSDGSEKEITDYTLSLKNGTKLSKEQIYIIEVEYKGFVQTFDIEVLPVITGIKITSFPEKRIYHVSEFVDYSGMRVIATYSDGQEEEILDYSVSIAEGTVLAKEQTCSIKVMYNGFSAIFDIDVLPNLVSDIQVVLPTHSDIENLLTYDDEKKILIAKAGFAKYTWWLDSRKISNQTASYTLNTLILSSGYHSIMIVVKTSDGESFSSTATINILREER